MQDHHKRNWFEEVCYTIRHGQSCNKEIRIAEARSTQRIIIEQSNKFEQSNKSKMSLQSIVGSVASFEFIRKFF
jgi:hypothetical protein